MNSARTCGLGLNVRTITKIDGRIKRIMIRTTIRNRTMDVTSLIHDSGLGKWFRIEVYSSGFL